MGNRAVYGGRAHRLHERQKKDDLRKRHTVAQEKRVKADEKQSRANVRANKAYVQGAKAEELVAKQMSGDDWDRAIMKSANRDTSFLKSKGESSLPNPVT